MPGTIIKRSVEVCLAPPSFSRRQVKDDLIIVVVDILRATSAMCTALANGAAGIFPVASLARARKLQAGGYFVAAERGGVKPAFADAGNSPFELGPENVKGKKIAYSTTNGTLAIGVAAGRGRVVLGSFLNRKALSDWLIRNEGNVLILCAGWEGAMSLEDTLFAGDLSGILLASGLFTTVGDEIVGALELRKAAGSKLQSFASMGSHYGRLKGLGRQEDLDRCFRTDLFSVIPTLENGIIIAAG